MDPLDSRPRPRDDLAARSIAGEAVVVTPADSKVHELDPVATFVFERCDGERSGHDLVRLLLEAFEVAPDVAERDVALLLRTFAERGLVELLPPKA